MQAAPLRFVFPLYRFRGPDTDSLDPVSQSRKWIRLDLRGADAIVAFRDIKRSGNKRDGGVQDPVDSTSNNAGMGPRHAEVALKGRPPWKDLFVGRGNVGVGSQYRSHATIQVPSQGLLVASGFGMKVDANDPDTWKLLVDFLQSAICRDKGAINGFHEDTSLQVQHGHLNATGSGQDGPAAPRRGSGEICRPQDFSGVF